MGKTQLTGNLTNAISQDASNNVGIGAAPSGSYKLEVTGTAKVSGILTLGSTISNGTYAYTLPSATGTLALTSALGDYLPLAGGTLTGALGGTSATFGGLLTINVPTDNTTVGIFHAGGGTANRGLKISTFVSVNDNAGVRLDAQTTVGGATLALATAGVDRLTIASTGAATFSSSVGVGGSPTGTYGTLSVFGGISIKNDNNAKFEIGRYSSGASNSYIKLGANSNSLRVTDNLDQFDIFTITNAGNVGIGTSSPNAPLNVVKDDGVAAGLHILADFNRNTSSAELILGYYGDGTSVTTNAIYSANSLPLAFYTGATERMRIVSGSNTLVIGGTVGAYTATNRGNLTLSGSASALLGFHNGTTQTGYIYNDHSASVFQWYSVSNPIEIISVSLGVRLNTNATSWSPISSDERTKKNFETTQGLNEVLQIEPIKYHFIEENDNAVKRLGFKAQNLQSLIPEMVYITGKKMEDGSDILTITPDYLLPVLVKAIQELNERLNKAGL